jgi:RNA polymerase sigma factor (sigma-70 family)
MQVRQSSTMEDDSPGAHLAPAVEFEVFYRAHYREVVALARSLCGSWAAAEELAQDAFLAASRDWGRIGAYEKPVAWVCRAVANRSTSLLRRRLVEARAIGRLAARRAAPDGLLEGPDEALWKAVRALPTRQAEVVSLHFVGGYELTEIAALLGMSAATVRVHLHRARRTLAARLSYQYEGGGDEPAG